MHTRIHTYTHTHTHTYIQIYDYLFGKPTDVREDSKLTGWYVKRRRMET